MATATQTSKILSAEQEAKLRQPIDEYVGKIQAQIDELRTDGTEKAVNIQNELDNLKRDRIYTAQEKTERETKLKAELAAAKAVEEKNKGQINKLIADAEAYLKAHYDSDYYQAVVASCKQEKVQAQQKYQATVEQLKKEHETLALLERAFVPQGEKTVEVVRSFGFYPSDQRCFVRGAGVCALKKSRWFGYYMDKIHTRRDCAFDEKNIALLCAGAIRLAEQI